MVGVQGVLEPARKGPGVLGVERTTASAADLVAQVGNGRRKVGRVMIGVEVKQMSEPPVQDSLSTAGCDRAGGGETVVWVDLVRRLPEMSSTRQVPAMAPSTADIIQPSPPMAGGASRGC